MAPGRVARGSAAHRTVQGREATSSSPAPWQSTNAGRSPEGLSRKSFLRDAPGKGWDARSPEDRESINNNSINRFSFLNIVHDHLNVK
jgi:hypothetical protein